MTLPGLRGQRQPSKGNPAGYTKGLPFKVGVGVNGRRLLSLPGTPVAGPLALDDEAMATVLRYAVEFVRAEPPHELEIKTREDGVRSYIPEKKQKGRRNWAGKQAVQQAVYANRRRVRGEYGKSLARRGGELVERSFARCYETGGMRRCHLRGHENILRRQLIHVGAFNLSLILPKLLGAGTPRELRNLRSAVVLFVLFVFQRGNTPKQSCRSRCASFRPSTWSGRAVSPSEF